MRDGAWGMNVTRMACFVRDRWAELWIWLANCHLGFRSLACRMAVVSVPEEEGIVNILMRH